MKIGALCIVYRGGDLAQEGVANHLVLALRETSKGPPLNNSLVLASEASRLAALLLGHWSTGQLRRRALPSGRLETEPRSTCS